MKKFKGAITAGVLACALFLFIQPLVVEAGALPQQSSQIGITLQCAQAGYLYWTLLPIRHQAVKASAGISHILDIGLPIEFKLEGVTSGSINNIKQIEQCI